MKIKFIALIAILACLLIVIPVGFAVNNDTASDDGEVLQADYYFDANVSDDTGNGSMDNPYKELTPNRMGSNSVLHLANGEYDLKGQSQTVNNITIIGENPTSTIVKNARFTVSTSLTLCNVTLLSSPITNNGNLNATNSIFRGVSKDSYGGAINSNSHVNLDNCTFLNNNAGCGGAIYCKDGSLNIANSKFLDNGATGFGGAILAISSKIYVDNSIFENNRAYYYGGAIYTLYSQFNLTNSRFDRNSAKEGGALLIDDANPCLIFANEFSNNNASTVGALYSIANNVSNSLLADNSFSNNSGSIENDVLESAVPNMFISDGDYILIYYNQTFNGTLPDSYDLRDYGYVTPVKSQGSGGNCWAFSSLAALESCILKANGISYDLSEENMKNLMGRYSDYGFKLETNKGGRDDMAIAYLLSWLGPVNESDDKYDASSLLSPVLDSFYHIQNVIFLKRNNFTDNELIKRAIIEYGAVSTSIYWSQGSYGKNGNYYYSGSQSSNHAVTIVGWDDNYSKSNFKTAPEGDGAWIVKNSHGTSSGKGGYWYVSYYDTRCAQVGAEEVSFTFILNDTIKYDKNYQYDIPGRTDIFLNSSSTVWFKNVFTATGNEYLAAVSTYFYKLSNYTFNIYVNNVLKHTQSGISNPGQYTINLNQFVPLCDGDIFEVAFKVSVDGEAYFAISEPVSLNKALFSPNSSFVSYDGENWTDLYNLSWRYSTHTYNSQVACIKAFTVYDLINTTTQLSVDITSGFNVKATVLNQYNRPVTGGTVKFDINGEKYDVDVVNGVAVLALLSAPEKYDITAQYSNVGYISSEGNLTFTPSFLATNISLVFSGEHNPLGITAIVLNQEGFVVEVGNVTFTVDGVSCTVNITNGTATLTQVFETFGRHNVEAVFNPIYYYESSSIQRDFYVSLMESNLTLTISNEYNPVYILANITDSYGNAISYGNVTFTVDGIQYVVDVVNGTANLTHTFKNIALNTVDAVYNGLFYYDSSNVSSSFVVNPTIISDDEVKTLNSQYKIRVLDNYGNGLNNTEISVRINSIVYKIRTDENGIATFNIELAPNRYVFEITNPFNNEIKNQTIVVVERVTENRDIEIFYGAGRYYTVKALDDDGNPAIGVTVTFTVNNNNYNIKTDKNGYASYKISLKPGKYTITAEYNGFKVSNIINVKTTLITKNINVKKGKTIKFTAKLLDKNGKALKGKKIKFKFNGKKYKAKTNSKGKATLKIANKYKAGKYAITSSYGDLKVKNIIKIKK